MKAIVLKFADLTPELESKIDRFMYVEMQKLFSEEEQEEIMIMDEDEATLVAFVDENQHNKLNQLVGGIKLLDNSAIAKYEDVTDNFLYNNDFSDYTKKSDKIDSFIKSHLDVDAVLDKISNIGIDRLIDADREILEAASH